MEQNLISVMAECRNDFRRRSQEGRFALCGGVIRLALPVQTGQYIRICGSTLHDGVYRVSEAAQDGEEVAVTIGGGGDEEFSGVVYALAVPKEFVALTEEIREWKESQPFDRSLTGERFADYSYTRAAPDGLARDWPEVFRDRLRPYRRMFG